MPFAAAALAVASWIELRTDRFGDTDSFYHLSHAGHYLSAGALAADFPFIPTSVLNRNGGDIWYGFHLLLVPLASVGDPVVALKAASIGIVVFMLSCYYAALARLHIRGAAFLPFVALFATPNGLTHQTMMRPHVMSLGIAALLFSFTLRGGAGRVAVLAAALSFIHLSLSWVAPLVVMGCVAALALVERRLHLGHLAASIGGLLIGAAARPRPLGALRTAYVQIVDFLIEKRRGTPLLFGQELYPLPIAHLYRTFAPFLVLWIAALAWGALLWRRSRADQRDARTALAAATILSAGFFLMMLVVARRAYDQWAFFGAAAMGATVSLASGTSARRPLRSLYFVAASCLAVAMAARSSAIDRRSLRGGADAHALEDIARHLAAQPTSGEVVYHASWDTFPQLLLWDRSHRYVAGIDPIFLYAFDPALYWRYHHLERGDTGEATCPKPVCVPADLEDPYAVLRRDFHARYLVVEKVGLPLEGFARKDPRFALEVDGRSGALFALR